MARISTYDLDTNITVKDIIIGSDGEHWSRYATKNFSVGDIAEFITKYIEDNSPCCNSTITTSTTTLMPTTTTTTLLPTTTTTTLLPTTTTTTTILVPTTTTTTTSTPSDCSLSGFFIETAVPTTTTTTTAVPTTTTTTTSIVAVNYGYLYNWFVVGDVRNVANTGWNVPLDSDFATLTTFLGGHLIAGAAMKETGTLYWDTPNTGATNSSGFNGKGSGERAASGTFVSAKTLLFLYKRDPLHSDLADGRTLSASTDWVGYTSDSPKIGFSLRLVKDTTTLTDGQTGTYIGNDGKVYRTICIGTQEWLGDNLLETKYRNNDPIPEVTDDAVWASLSTGARCSYDNNPSNA